MSQHELLQQRVEQHRIKNILSKYDDKKMKSCSYATIALLEELMPEHTFSFKNELTFQEIASFISKPLSSSFKDRKILPDGGVIWMDNKYPILIGEIKRQGTNDEREKEGKNKQATGNAIERYGKNLMALQTMFNSEKILPAVVFVGDVIFLKIN